MDKVKYLSRINLFQALDLGDIEQIEPVTPINVVKKGTLISSPHSKQQLLYFVKSGRVRLYKLSECGKELTLDVLGTGHLFGEVGSFTTGSENLYAATMEDSVICTIDRAQFETILRDRPDLALQFIEVVSTRLKELEEMLEHMAYGSVRKRLLYLLTKLLEKFGMQSPAAEGWVELEVTLTHQELATMMGSIRETVTDLVNGLAAEGIVKKRGPRQPLSVHPERLRIALEACK